jgi:exodeoxyribonuclease V beta subunit
MGWGLLPSGIQEGESLIEAFLELGRKTITHPLPGVGCALKGIAQKDRVLEMEFFFRLNSTKTNMDFLRALTEDESLSLPFWGYPQKTLRGLMNGFIDMVFRHECRYYILDYKTNDLGQRKDAYGKEAIKAAMAEHTYHLQYTIYLIALHRYLKANLKGYTPKALGGVYYLFVRGLQGFGEDGIFYLSDVRPSWILRLDDFLESNTLP